MAASQEIEHLEKEFQSGRNPMAFIPLCQALRQRGSHSRALEFCNRGLEKNPESMAGQTMRARLLNDLGHHEDALKTTDAALVNHPTVMGLLVEKARALLAMTSYEAVEPIISQLNNMNPMDPQVKEMSSQWKRALALGTAQHSGVQQLPTEFSKPKPQKEIELTYSEIAEEIRREVASLCAVHSCSVIPRGAGDPGLVGEPSVAEAGFAFFKGVDKSCEELDNGAMVTGVMETDKMTVIVLVRTDSIVTLGIEPSGQFGKILFRMQNVVDRYLDNP
ncbi:MAG: tetratricopeptide repeat protein [Candidatus Sumerlaeia bacterium]|nr:tetratricopeptide repeat protein [Candidatus Sumerlaeia bacterium]